MRGWLGQPWVAVLCALLVFTLAWHSKLGVQVVIEDYVHGKGAKTTLLLLSTSYILPPPWLASSRSCA